MDVSVRVSVYLYKCISYQLLNIIMHIVRIPFRYKRFTAAFQRINISIKVYSRGLVSKYYVK